MLRGKSKKIFAFLLALAILASVLLLSSCKLKLPNLPTTGSESEEGKLATPKNVSFNDNTNEVSWQGVENATGYLLWVNGNTYEIGAVDLSKKIVLLEGINEFKVKAIGDEEFADSNWSQTVTYTMTVQAEESLYNKVNIKVAETAKDNGYDYGYELIRVVGISSARLEANRFGENICFEVVAQKSGKLYNLQVRYGWDDAETVQEMIENIDKAAPIKTYINKVATYNAKNAVTQLDKHDKNKLNEDGSYKSAESLLKSGSYDGKMQELKNHGYQITVLDSVVREGYENGSEFAFNIVGTYKATKAGADDVYFSSIMRVDILNPSRNEVANYTTFLEYEQYRNVTEKKYVLHEKGTTLDYILDWEQKSVEEQVPSTN
ncbi:MAG: hypothetical protein E7602_05465 [Ruminococcaceae bacterium]|nr:hypothetical protein [Oscillospiraceae bacterium]